MTDREESDKIEQLKKGWLDQAARDASEIVRLETKIEDLDDALERIEGWCSAYPIKAFLPLTDEQVQMVSKFCEMNGISFGGLHAQWARHILLGLLDIIRIARKE